MVSFQSTVFFFFFRRFRRCCCCYELLLLTQPHSTESINQNKLIFNKVSCGAWTTIINKIIELTSNNKITSILSLFCVIVWLNVDLSKMYTFVVVGWIRMPCAECWTPNAEIHTATRTNSGNVKRKCKYLFRKYCTQTEQCALCTVLHSIGGLMDME